KPVGQGTGLGLSVVRQIITWHGGHVRIGNRLPRGARVDIYLSPAHRPSVERIETHQEYSI
ncbi:MAG TPA: ATP-binding protein, partial [Candidatus Paceibacterota bacterium]|nr:ATP-binding protein [Candidatus Paceibacterota bacterium]